MRPYSVLRITLSPLHVSSHVAFLTPEEEIAIISMTRKWRVEYNKSPTYEYWSYQVSTMLACIWFQQGTRTCVINVRCDEEFAHPLLQLHHLPLPVPPPVSNSSCLFPRCQPLYANCCTVLIRLEYCTIRLEMFIFVFVFLHMTCVKSFINLLQYTTI